MKIFYKIFLAMVVAGLLGQMSAGAIGFTYKKDGAKAPKHWVSMSWGGSPEYQLGYFIGHTPFVKYDIDWYNGNYLERLFSDYEGPIYTTGNFSFEFGWNINRVVGLAATVGFAPFWCDILDGYYNYEKSRRSGCTLYIMPQCRIMYINRKYFRFFGTIGLGIGFNAGAKYSDEPICVMGQIDPLCFEFGDKWYGLLKTGFGTETLGGKVGFGYRF